MSCSLAAGGSLQWFRNNFCAAEMQAAEALGIDVYQLLDKEAERVPIGANRLLFLPYIMGERSPILNPDARGVFFGLSGMHKRADMLRAVMEGVGYSLRDCMEAMRSMNVSPSRMIATGGGGRSPFWRQMIADILDCPIVTVKNREGPALGVAILAGVGAGLYRDIPSACEKIMALTEPQNPDKPAQARYEPYFKLYREVYESLKGQFAALAKLQ
jgi:xylulokinase